MPSGVAEPFARLGAEMLRLTLDGQDLDRHLDKTVEHVGLGSVLLPAPMATLSVDGACEGLRHVAHERGSGYQRAYAALGRDRLWAL